MGERYTKRDAYMAFARLASALGKTWSDDKGNLWKGSAYEPMEAGLLWAPYRTETPVTKVKATVGAWYLDHNGVYGGYVIHEMYNEGGGVSEPFGGMRRSAREFCDAVYFAENALRAAKVPT